MKTKSPASLWFLSTVSIALFALAACTPQSTIVATQVAEKDGMVQVYVPEGEFLMGAVNSDPEAEADEKPQRTVYLDAFWIDQTEVTNAKYALCVAAGVCQPPSYTEAYAIESYYGNPQYDHYPFIYVNWAAAQTYCEWAGGRLPTEAEWEKAARGTDGRKYPWGNTKIDGNLLNFADRRTNFRWSDQLVDDGYEGLAPVGNYPAGASAYGAWDMAGNVLEWTADWYSENYYANAPAKNPPGPESGQTRVLRGGSWHFGASTARTSDRFSVDAGIQDTDLGFRCAR